LRLRPFPAPPDIRDRIVRFCRLRRTGERPVAVGLAALIIFGSVLL